MAEFRRFFVDSVSAEFLVTGEEFQHAVNVLRIKEGENVIVCDNTGDEYFCVVKKINKKDFVYDEAYLYSILENKDCVALDILKSLTINENDTTIVLSNSNTM